METSPRAPIARVPAEYGEDGCGGDVLFSEKRCLSVMEVEYLGVGFGPVGGDIFSLGGGFDLVVVEMEVDDLSWR